MPATGPRTRKFPLGIAKSIYLLGNSLRQTALVIGWSPGYVNTKLKRTGVVRSEEESRKFRWLDVDLTNKRYARAVARKKMERHLGYKLPREDHVHHRDEDYTNSDLNNLEVMNASAHARLHHPKTGRSEASRLHKRLYAREYRKLYREKYLASMRASRQRRKNNNETE